MHRRTTAWKLDLCSSDLQSADTTMHKMKIGGKMCKLQFVPPYPHYQSHFLVNYPAVWHETPTTTLANDCWDFSGFIDLVEGLGVSLHCGGQEVWSNKAKLEGLS